MQLVRPEQGMRCIMESVHQDYSHGSRFINAWHVEGAQWELSGEDEPKVLFWDCPLVSREPWLSTICICICIARFQLVSQVRTG